MPELPEVEIAARQLARWGEGRVVRDVRVREPRSLATEPRRFRKALRGRRLTHVERHGKHVVATLCDDAKPETLLSIHLGMSGKLAWRAPRTRAPAHTRVEVRFDEGRVCFSDMRIFGRVMAGPPDDVRAPLADLGPDAWTGLSTTDDLVTALGPRKRPIKAALMDQKSIAGLGNIQAAEALFRAGIHPRAPVTTLDRAAMLRLFRGMRASLAFTLKATEAEEVEYMSEGGDNPFRVYGREGEACPRCGTTIEAFRLAGRNTFFCPTCQPEKS